MHRSRIDRKKKRGEGGEGRGMYEGVQIAQSLCFLSLRLSILGLKFGNVQSGLARFFLLLACCFTH